MTPDGFSVIREALELASHANHRDYSPIEIEQAAGRALAEVAAVEARLADAERERDEARQGLWECYVQSGADPDGNDRWYCDTPMAVRSAVESVTQLRTDYNEALDELSALSGREAPCEHDWVTEHGSATQWCVTCGAGREALGQTEETTT